MEARAAQQLHSEPEIVMPTTAGPGRGPISDQQQLVTKINAAASFLKHTEPPAQGPLAQGLPAQGPSIHELAAQAPPVHEPSTQGPLVYEQSSQNPPAYESPAQDVTWEAEEGIKEVDLPDNIEDIVKTMSPLTTASRCAHTGQQSMSASYSVSQPTLILRKQAVSA